MQCEAGRLHQNVEHCHVDFQPLAARHGGPAVGRILVTTFHNPWRALVRFDMGDLVRLQPSRVRAVVIKDSPSMPSEGRVANATLSRAGRLVTSARPMRRSPRSMASISTSWVQTAADTVSLRSVSDTRDPARIEPELRASLQRCYGASVKIILGACSVRCHPFWASSID